MASTRKFYKQVFTVTVLSEEIPLDEEISLEDLGDAITNGACSGLISCVTVQIDAPEMAQMLYNQGSDPGFFSLDDYGNDKED